VRERYREGERESWRIRERGREGEWENKKERERGKDIKRALLM
jgi:hypothetical protein